MGNALVSLWSLFSDGRVIHFYGNDKADTCIPVRSLEDLCSLSVENDRMYEVGYTNPNVVSTTQQKIDQMLHQK